MPKTTIKDGDTWYEKEILLVPKKLQSSVSLALGRNPNKALFSGHFEKVALRWMKRDKDGNIVPR